MSPISKRRSIRLPRLVRLPSKSGESTTSYSDGTSCPNSPAVKKTYRLVVVGSARSGKSAIVNRFLDQDFEDRYLPTIENFHRKLYKLRGEIYQLDILDRSGNDPFPAARKLSYITGDIFILVSSVDHAQSVEQMLEIYNQIVECKTGRMIRQASISNGSFHHRSSGSSNGLPPVVFVLNKTDLPAHKWQVSEQEVQELVTKVVNGREDCFVSCSALSNENVSKVFSRVFTLGKLPKYMNPETHKLLRTELSADRVMNSTCNVASNIIAPVSKKPVLQRMRSKFSKDNDDEIIIDVNARRPSLRTDLLLNRAKCVLAPASNGQSSPKIYDPTAGPPSNDNHKHCIIS